jgi:Mg/Co/Ni transporter MgtE
VAAALVAERDRVAVALRMLGWIVLGAASIAGIAALEMAREGILRGFVSDAIGGSLGIRIDDSGAFRVHYLLTTLRANPITWALAVLGVVSALRTRTRLAPAPLWVLGMSLAAGVVGLFERAIEQVVLLAVFMPVVAGMAGTAGIQSLTVVARGIALGEAELSTAGRAVFNQSLVGLLVGAATGAAAAAIASWWGTSPVMGLVVFAAILVSMTVASLSGAAVPLVLKAVGQDPALGSGVIVTTFTDAIGFFSFLGIATLALDRLV